MRYILDFVDSMTDVDVNEYATSNEITLLKQFDALGQVYLAECGSEPVADDKLLVCTLDENKPIKLLSTNVTLVDNKEYRDVYIDNDHDWWKVASIQNISFDNPTFSHTVRGENATVYLLDSGINLEHDEFTNRNVSLFHSFTDNFTDKTGHGTGLASVITGNTCSLSSTNLKVVKVFDPDVESLQSDLLSALDAIIKDYIANGRGPTIANMSWSIDYNELINRKIQLMIDMGIYVVCAAGNSGKHITDVTPACILDAITVGSINQDFEPSNFTNYTAEDSIISFTNGNTNYGELDGWAPGERIYAANKFGGYSYITGTSVSSAIVASALAHNLAVYLGISTVDMSTLGGWNNESLMNLVKRTVFRREGLVNVEGEYINSGTGLVTFQYAGRVVNTHNGYKVQAGKRFVSLYANPFFYQRVLSADDLPDCVTLREDGFLEIDKPEIDEPYIIFPQINMTIIDKQGEVVNNILTIMIYNQNNTFTEVFEEAALNDDDKVLDFVALNCEYNPSFGGCSGLCADYGKTCIGDKFACYCFD